MARCAVAVLSRVTGAIRVAARTIGAHIIGREPVLMDTRGRITCVLCSVAVHFSSVGTLRRATRAGAVGVVGASVCVVTQGSKSCDLCSVAVHF